MRNLIIILILTFTTGMLKGQSQEVLDKIEAAKIALITQRLELTPEQAEKFWPIYREYANKQQEIHKNFQQLKRNYNPNTASEEESKNLVQQGQRIRESMINLDKEYSDRMLQVINNRQLLSLRKAEADFREELMRRLKQRQQQRDQLRDPANQDLRQRRLQDREN